jgi:hypothetical protein
MLVYPDMDVISMPGSYRSIFLFFVLLIMLAPIGLHLFLRRIQDHWADNMDNSAWFMVGILVVAILSLGLFIAFMFLGAIVG